DTHLCGEVASERPPDGPAPSPSRPPPPCLRRVPVQVEPDGVQHRHLPPVQRQPHRVHWVQPLLCLLYTELTETERERDRERDMERETEREREREQYKLSGAE